MQLLLDSADEAQIRYWWAQGVLDGVTTNPTVLRRDQIDDPRSTVVAIAHSVSTGTVHVEVTSEAGDELVSEAVELSRVADNVVVKVPVLTPDGKPLLREISTLAAAGVVVNSTACMSLTQVLMAAKAGARFVSILVGRIDDECGAGADVVAQARTWLDDWQLPVKLIAASMRGPADVSRSMQARAHCITVPPDVLAKLVDHKYARHTVAQFLEDGRRHV